jgi:hypothetical protein
MVEYPRPAAGDYADYYAGYVRRVPPGPILTILERQLEETLALLRPLEEEQAGFRYAPGKWSIREVVGHIIDTERILGVHALRFARGDGGPLPSFEQDDFVRSAGFDRRTLADLLEELRLVRASTIAFFRGLPAEALDRSGIEGGQRLVVRAVPFILAGHELHHRAVLLERYLGAIAT